MNTMSTRDVALAWRASGIVTIPCRVRSKIPIVKWKRWQTALPPELLVKTWFGNGRRNLGLITGGPGNLVVFDFDAIGSFVRWANQHKDLAKTYSVETRRCRHLYFIVTVPPNQSSDWVGCNLKASGIVLAPPSVHPTGKPYKAVNDHADILRLPDLQDALVGLDPLPAPEAYQDVVKDQIDTPSTHMCANRTQIYLYYGVIKDIRRALSALTLANRYTIMRPSDNAGRWWLGRCPNPSHEDVHPSFRVDAVGNFARCLTPSCALFEPRGMDTVELYRRLHGLHSRDATAALAVELGLVR